MPNKSHTTNKPAIEVKDLVVSYNESLVLDHISFAIKRGQIAAILGPNGSGKTTLIRAILGLIKRKSGVVRLLGRHIHEVRDRVSYIPQVFEFDRHFPMTVWEFMNLARHREREPTVIQSKIREVELPPEVLDQQIGTLSGGQLQRVLIAQAIINNPEILILDEPSTGIDISGEGTFINILRHLKKTHGTTILLVSHDVSMVLDLVDTVVCVNKQLICAGPPKQALTERKLADLYGGDAHLYEHHQHHP